MTVTKTVAFHKDDLGLRAGRWSDSKARPNRKHTGIAVAHCILAFIGTWGEQILEFPHSIAPESLDDHLEKINWEIPTFILKLQTQRATQAIK